MMIFRIHLLFIYITLCLLSLYNANPSETPKRPTKIQIVNFAWDNCGAPADPFQIRSFDLTPDPVRVPGNITAGFSFSFANPSPTDIAMIVVMQKRIDGFFIKVPCVNNIGSCTYYDICTHWTTICSALFAPYGVPCNCPIPVGTFTIPDTTVEATQTLQPEDQGTFRIYANLLSGSAGQLGCLGLEINISS